MGTAYVGAASLSLYAELEPGAAVAGELPFGDPVELLRRRRNFYFVRNASGIEGWTHRSGLFNERQVAEVNALARFAAENPPQGEARVFAVLNVHNHPNRLAPSIFQIQEEERVAVVAHEWHPRQPYDPGPLLGPGSSAPSPSREGSEESEEILPPELPPPPRPPQAWLGLSGLSPERIQELSAEGLTSAASARPAVSSAGDLWTLVLNERGLAGWALNARLSPAIPDRVAQYAEGARITSYFSLGPANREETAHHWLWTTLSRSASAGHWDGIRVFTWNNRLSRYETAFIQRGLEGYLPVEVMDTEEGAGKRFRITVRERSGIIHRKTYEMQGVRVRLVQNVPWPSFDPAKQAPIMERLPDPPSEGRPVPGPQPGFWERMFGR